MEISVGQPQHDGRYVAFVQCASTQIPDWCEPVIAYWDQKNGWHTRGAVYGWIGPLPIAKRKSLLDRLPVAKLEYDL